MPNQNDDNSKLTPLVWKERDSFVLCDYWTKRGCAYALYRVHPEFIPIAEITNFSLPIKNRAEYENYKDQIIKISDIPDKILIEKLMAIPMRLWEITHPEPDFELNPQKVKELVPYRRSIGWLYNKLAEFHKQHQLPNKNYALMEPVFPVFSDKEVIGLLKRIMNLIDKIPKENV